MLKKLGAGHGSDSSGSGYGPVASACQHGHGSSGAIKGRELHNKWRENWHFVKVSAAWRSNAHRMQWNPEDAKHEYLHPLKCDDM